MFWFVCKANIEMVWWFLENKGNHRWQDWMELPILVKVKGNP